MLSFSAVRPGAGPLRSTGGLRARERNATIVIMSQTVEISDEMVEDARRTAEQAERSIADQIELWAQLGRAIEQHLTADGALALRRAGASRPLSECLASVDSDQGHRRVRDYLDSRPYPHYEPVPDNPGLLIRIEADGTRTLGRFVGRDFQVAK
jgi:hypothetical protein